MAVIHADGVDRVAMLATRARAAMVDEVKELQRQDPAQATKTKAMFEAKLASILKAIDVMPPAAYDVRLTNRVIKLQEDGDRENDPVWLTSPLHTGMREGRADFIRTCLHRAPPRVQSPTTTAYGFGDCARACPSGCTWPYYSWCHSN